MANNNTREVFLGMVSAYAYAVSKGYTGTEEEFAEGLARSADYADNAEQSADISASKALDSEAFGAGTRAGEPVESDDPAYHNNAGYYAGKAASDASDSEAYGTGKRGGVDVDSSDPAYHNSAKYFYQQAKDVHDSIPEDYSELSANVVALTGRVDTLEELDGVHRYGVSGLLNSSPTLTRLYDAVGLTATVGTDAATATNDFDDRTPFNRRKCVGTWNMINGKPVFEVNAYLGDEDYAEDGTMGDYVAVECPRAFYKMDGTTLEISAHQYPGYRPFDIFCRNHDPEDTMPFYYLPAYALALDEDGHAVSLPGLDNCQGDYKTLFDAARTYKNGALGQFAILQPAAVNFYEWALFTVEFATNNCQAIMAGCSALRHNADDRVTFIDEEHLLTNNYYASRVDGQYVAIISTATDINTYTYLATHKVISVTRCDASGTADASGTHQLLEVEDLGKEYFEYDLTGATEYRIAARPYRTGACNDVLTPSGSPVSNSNGYYPMRYRYRENVFANQYKTVVDLFAMRVGTGDSDYYLEWYYITNPADVTTPKNYGSADMADSIFTKLGTETPHANYVSGYIKTKKYDAEFPDIWIPGDTTGSATTYFCDYASLVHSSVVRSVRLGGHWSNGSLDGFSYVYAYTAPSTGSATYGGDLCIAQ